MKKYILLLLIPVMVACSGDNEPSDTIKEKIENAVKTYFYEQAHGYEPVSFSEYKTLKIKYDESIYYKLNVKHIDSYKNELDIITTQLNRGDDVIHINDEELLRHEALNRINSLKMRIEQRERSAEEFKSKFTKTSYSVRHEFKPAIDSRNSTYIFILNSNFELIGSAWLDDPIWNK